MKKHTCLFLLIFQSILLPYQTDVHPYLTREAFYMLQSLYPGVELSELGTQFGQMDDYGGTAWEKGTVLAGSYREDMEDVVWRYGPNSNFPLSYLLSNAPSPTVTHFWVADHGDNYKTPGICFFWQPSPPNAYEKARKCVEGGFDLLYIEPGSRYIKVYQYDNLITLAKTGFIKQTGYYDVATVQYYSLNPAQTVSLSSNLRKKFVYEILGRLIHLLQDMSVPAHAQGDPHPDLENNLYLPCFGADWCSDPDSYENWVDQNFASGYHFFDALDAGGLLLDNDFMADPIRFLFYTTNQVANFFPSDDKGGDNLTPNGGSNSIISSVYSSFNYQCPSSVNVGQIAGVNIIMSIRATAMLLYWFAQEMDFLKTVTYASNIENKYIQIRKPALSINPSSQYVFKSTPYTESFNSNITVDVSADVFAGLEQFNRWELRNKNNLIINQNLNYEWLNVSINSTSTIVANYTPFVNLSLAPILYEPPGDVHYMNFTTGEISSSFTLLAGYPVTIQAIASTEYIFQGWNDGHIENPRSFNLQTDMGGIYAIFKKKCISNNSSGYYYNNQRRFVRTSDNYLHRVYESMGYVWYEVRNPDTQIWEIKNGGKPLGNGHGKNPSIDSRNDMVVVVWQGNAGSTGSNIKLATFRYDSDIYDTEVLETTLATEYLGYQMNLEPVVVWANNSYALAAWHGYYDCVWGPAEGLKYKYFTLASNSLTLYSSGYIRSSNEYSTNPTISIYKNPSPSSPPLFHFAWSQNGTSVYYCQLNPTLADTLHQRVSAQDNSNYKNLSTYSGYTKNYMPTLAILNDDLARIAG